METPAVSSPAKLLPAPQVDKLIWCAEKSYEITDDCTKGLVMGIFQRLQSIAACGDDERRELWICAPRGSIEDFGRYEDYLEEGEVESGKEFEEMWLSRYPEKQKWYLLTTTVYKDIYCVFIDRKLVLQSQPQPLGQYPYDQSELAGWLLSVVEEAISSLKCGSYNEYVRDNLPYRKRLGKILRQDYWGIFPEEREQYLKDIDPDEVTQFTGIVGDQPVDSPPSRLLEMTSGLFFDICRVGYEANSYEGSGKLTPKHMYRAHADGRDDGLMDLDESSAEAFNSWYHDRTRYSGHPWEVCRGGNSTHISLYVCHDEKGWWLMLAGSSLGRSVETVKFYLALMIHGLPVFLTDGMEIAAMLTGKDYIGIVPEGIIPRYCASLFPGERIIDFMNLPWERTEQVEKAAIWYPLRNVSLVG